MIRSVFGLLFGSGKNVRALGASVTSVAEVFRPNATRALELGHDAYKAAHASHAAEFQYGRGGWFDSFVNGLNRLPRPLLALGTLALFGYAMSDPAGFAIRMQALGHVPEPLWWLLGAVVAFYFGAREAHHLRCTKLPTVPVAQMVAPQPDPAPLPSETPANPALAEWQSAAR
ncbi:MAG: methionine synthase I [Rhodobacteraceae bacterium]|nr:MAG: methionine synthase I [Paracoccaceae bacterium]